MIVQLVHNDVHGVHMVTYGHCGSLYTARALAAVLTLGMLRASIPSMTTKCFLLVAPHANAEAEDMSCFTVSSWRILSEARSLLPMLKPGSVIFLRAYEGDDFSEVSKSWRCEVPGRPDFAALRATYG